MPEESLTFDRIKFLIAEEYAINSSLIHPLSNLQDDLGLDSLDITDLELELEDEFGLEKVVIPDEVQTIEDLVRYIDGQLGR